MKAYIALLVLLLPVVGCGDDGHDDTPFGTYQECFDRHAPPTRATVHEALVECCLDHPIAGMAPACGATRPDCINYLTANLMQTSASTVEVMDACAEYETKLTP